MAEKTAKKTAGKTAKTTKTKALPPASSKAVKKASTLLQKGVLIGLGATIKTTEHLKDMMNNLVEQGELSPKEANTFGKDIKKLITDEKKIVEKRVQETVDATVAKVIKSMKLVTQTELKKETAVLKKEIATLKKTGTVSKKTTRPAARKKTAKKTVKPSAKTKK